MFCHPIRKDIMKTFEVWVLRIRTMIDLRAFREVYYYYYYCYLFKVNFKVVTVLSLDALRLSMLSVVAPTYLMEGHF